jgi:hypothetical protein
VKFNYLKDFALISKKRHKGKYRVYFCMWFIESPNKCRLRPFTGIGKTKKKALENTWRRLSKELKSGGMKVEKEIIEPISIAPALRIPNEYKSIIEFYNKELNE